MLARQFTADVGAELFHVHCQSVVANLRAPHSGDVPQVSIERNKQVRVRRCADARTPRMVAVGRERAAKNLRVVELRMTRIDAGDEDSAPG